MLCIENFSSKVSSGALLLERSEPADVSLAECVYLRVQAFSSLQSERLVRSECAWKRSMRENGEKTIVVVVERSAPRDTCYVQKCANPC